MATIETHHPAHHDASVTHRDTSDPAYQAFFVLRAAFVVAPILFGLDKFTNLMTEWDRYLAPALSNPLPFTAHQQMYVVGVIEVIAGLVVLLRPRLGAAVVTVSLAGIIVNLLLLANFYDVALRDFGLLLAAVALQRLSTRFDAHALLWPLRKD